MKWIDRMACWKFAAICWAICVAFVGGAELGRASVLAAAAGMTTKQAVMQAIDREYDRIVEQRNGR